MSLAERREQTGDTTEPLPKEALEWLKVAGRSLLVESDNDLTIALGYATLLMEDEGVAERTKHHAEVFRQSVERVRERAEKLARANSDLKIDVTHEAGPVLILNEGIIR
jgi:hypothetical protein